MSLDSNKTYLVWNGAQFPNSASATFKAPAGSTIDWGDGTVETFDTASTTVNTHTYTDGKTEHTIAISGLTRIGSLAFYYCRGLTSVTIGNSVTSIGNSAFYYCSSLTSVTIGNSVTIINNSAFYYCSSLVQLILFPSSPPTLGSSAIPTTVQSIYVQQSSKAAYQAATNWTAFASKIVSDNIYLSFVRFNQKNKEYIDGKVNERLTAPTTPTSDSVVTMAANGTTGTKPLSEFGGKLYRHRIRYSYTNVSTSDTDVYIDIITLSGTAFTQPSEFISLVDKKIAIVDGMHIRGSAFVQEAGNNSISIYGCGYNVGNTTSPVTIFTQLDVGLFVNDTVTEL